MCALWSYHTEGTARLGWGNPVHTKAWLTPLLTDE